MKILTVRVVSHRVVVPGIGGRLELVDHPFFSKSKVYEISVGVRDLQIEQSHELAPKFAGKYPYREKKFLLQRLPLIRKEPEMFF